MSLPNSKLLAKNLDLSTSLLKLKMSMIKDIMQEIFIQIETFTLEQEQKILKMINGDFGRMN